VASFTGIGGSFDQEYTIIAQREQKLAKARELRVEYKIHIPP